MKPTDIPNKHHPITISQIDLMIVNVDPIIMRISMIIKDFRYPNFAEKFAKSDPKNAPIETDAVISEVKKVFASSSQKSN